VATLVTCLNAGAFADDKGGGTVISQTVFAEGRGQTADEAVAAARIQALVDAGKDLLDTDSPNRFEAELRRLATLQGKCLGETKTLVLHRDGEEPTARIVARVRTAELSEQLARGGLMVKDSAIAGDSPEFARVTAKSRLRKVAVKAFYKVFDAYPFGCVTTELVGKPTVKERDDDVAEMTATVRYTLDTRRYAEVVEYLDVVLNTICSAQGDFPLKFAANPREAGTFVNQTRDGVTGRALRMGVFTQAARDSMFKDKGSVVSLCTKFDEASGASTWKYYFLPGNNLAIGVRGVGQMTPGRVALHLLDRNGKSISVVDRLTKDPGGRRPMFAHNDEIAAARDLAIGPMLLDDHEMRRSVTRQYMFLVRVNDLQRFASARFVQEWSPPWDQKKSAWALQEELRSR
jgi:hypothetical protein